MAELTADELAELSSRILAGDTKAIAEAVKLTKSARPRRAATPRPPKREPTEIERLRKWFEGFQKDTARILALREEKDALRSAGPAEWNTDQWKRQATIHGDLSRAFCGLHESARYLCAKLPALLDRLEASP